MHWACAKISSSPSFHDVALLEILLDKVCLKLLISFSIAFSVLLMPFFFFSFQLKICKGISYAAVAAHAEKCDRRKLAAMLVDHEPLSSKQVLLMI